MSEAALLARLAARLPLIDGFLSIEGGQMPDPATPLTAQEQSAAEARIGAAVPPLLAEAYGQLGNGGWGPGWGMMGLGGGHADDQGNTACTGYQALRAEFADWPEALVPICDMGCAIAHCLSFSTGEIIAFDPNTWDGEAPYATILYPLGVDLAQWLAHWAEGHDPFRLLYGPTGTAPILPALG